MKKILKSTLCALTFAGLLTTNVLATDNSSKETDPYLDQNLYVVDGVAYYECGQPIQNLSEIEIDTTNEKALECHCGGALSINIVFTGNWYYTGVSKSCIHKNFGHDYEKKQQIIRRYSCNKCLERYELTSYNTTWDCKGFNY